jgi:hypothetical protein
MATTQTAAECSRETSVIIAPNDRGGTVRIAYGPPSEPRNDLSGQRAGWQRGGAHTARALRVRRWMVYCSGLPPILSKLTGGPAREGWDRQTPPRDKASSGLVSSNRTASLPYRLLLGGFVRTAKSCKTKGGGGPSRKNPIPLFCREVKSSLFQRKFGSEMDNPGWSKAFGQPGKAAVRFLIGLKQRARQRKSRTTKSHALLGDTTHRYFPCRVRSQRIDERNCHF